MDHDVKSLLTGSDDGTPLFTAMKNKQPALFFSWLLYFYGYYLSGLIGVLRKIRPVTMQPSESTNRVVRVTLYTAGILIALHVFGMKLTSLFTTSDLFAVALGFALKSIAENYAAGLMNRSNTVMCSSSLTSWSESKASEFPAPLSERKMTAIF